MSDAAIQIGLDSHEGPYFPGEDVRGTYQVTHPPEMEVRAVECSLLWHTVGKGDEDLAVVFFRREAAETMVPLHSDQERPFVCKLPASPLSYDGLVVKIVWCVRVRVFFRRGHELMMDKTFQVGDVAPASWIE